MPTTSINITTSAEAVKTYFITTYDDNTAFIKTTKSKFDSLLNLLGSLGVEYQDYGEMSKFDGIYEL